MLPAATRMHQFLDRPEWQDHIDQHSGNLGDSKAPLCPHPRVQCADAFESLQGLKFHLQDVHCVVPRKGSKRSSPESEVDTRPYKFSRHNLDLDSEAYVIQEHKFVDEAAKLRSWESYGRSTTSSISSKGSIPTPDWKADPDESGTETLQSSAFHTPDIESAQLSQLEPTIVE
jgi:hypothetical protein